MTDGGVGEDTGNDFWESRCYWKWMTCVTGTLLNICKKGYPPFSGQFSPSLCSMLSDHTNLKMCYMFDAQGKLLVIVAAEHERERENTTQKRGKSLLAYRLREWALT